MVFALLAVAVAFQGTVTGTVREAESGTPIASATVEVSGTRFRAVSDPAGRFVLRLPVGNHELVARIIGYRSARRQLAVAESSTVTADFALEPLSVPLAEVVVSPSRFTALDDAAPSTATLTREQIETMPQLGEDLYRSITRIPGMASADISARFWVRGGPNEEVLARLDGVELLEPFHLKDFDGALSIIDVGTIGALDLSTGGFTTEYGDRLTGVLDMRSIQPTNPGAHTTIGLSITSLRASSRGTFAGSRGEWLVSARRGYLDIALKLIGEGDSMSPAYYDIFAKAQYRLNDHHTVALHALHAGDDMTYATDNDPSLSSRYGSSYVWGEWRWLAGRALSATTVGSLGHITWYRRGLGEFNQRDSVDLTDDRSLDAAALRQDWSWAAAERALVKFGLAVQSLSGSYDYFSAVDRDTVRNDSLIVLRDTVAAVLAPSGTTIGAHVALRVQPVNPLTVEAGLRWDRQTYVGENETSPRLNASWRLGRATTVRAAWGVYYQAEGVHQIAVGDGETSFFRAERAEHRIIGVERTLPHGLGVRVEAYERRIAQHRPKYLNVGNTGPAFPELMTDRIVITPATGRARGLELLLERRLGGKFDWAASYALSEATDDVQGSTVPRSRDQRHALYLDATWAPDPAWRFSVSWQIHSGWPYTEAIFALDTLTGGTVVVTQSYGPLNANRLPAYHRLDFRVSRQWRFRGSTLNVYLDLFNALNASNPHGYDYSLRLQGSQLVATKIEDSQLPRLPSFGVSWEF